MLRSLIEPLQAMINSRESIGLAIDKSSITLTHVKKRDKDGEVINYACRPLAVELFNGAPSLQLVDALNREVLSIAEHIPKRYVPLHLSLPDPVVRMTLLEFESIPRKEDDIAELVKWRAEKELGSDSMVYAHQYLGLIEGRHHILTISMELGWYTAIVNALENAKAVLWSISANVLRQYNRYHDVLTQNSGALININIYYWSLLIWDKSGRLRYVHSYWKNDFRDMQEIASEIERSIIAYVNGHSGRDVSHVYCLCDDETKVFEQIINQRLSRPCTVLKSDDQIRNESHHASTIDEMQYSLAAALEK